MKPLWLAFTFAAALAAQNGFVPLFNGKTLDGWDGDPRLWKVEDGVIVGSTDGAPIKTNSFLITKRRFANFILRADMKLRNHNTGIQIRSEALPEWVVKGLQVDAAQNNYWGNLYDERGTRGIVVNSYKEKGSTVVRHGDWNTFEVLCDGDHIQVKLNGLVTADIHDTSPARDGIIALQLHAGPAMEVRFRNLTIKELPPR